MRIVGNPISSIVHFVETTKGMKHYLFLLTLLGSAGLAAQSYTSYFSGNETDAQTQPQGGVCMMGGATEHDNAMRWFLQRADGGDVLVLRASGADGYNSYLYSELGETVNSVETIVFNNASAATEPYVQQAIQQAEGGIDLSLSDQAADLFQGCFFRWHT